MNETILNTNIQDFINVNLDSNTDRLLLKGTLFKGVDTKSIIEQIESKRRCKKKLPTWFKTSNIYYPNKLNIEQTSSELTANHKASLINGESILDLTGGFGIDCFSFSKIFREVIYCEISEKLSEIVEYNYKQLKIENIETLNTNGLDFLRTTDKKFDWIYVDPSRRHDTKGKVFFLKDCLPNVPEALEQLFSHSTNIMIKTSPLLDLSIGLNELRHVKSIYIVAVNNEVKELLWVLEYNFKGEPTIETVNIKKEKNDYFNFTLEDEKVSASKYSVPLTYLYEPNAAILKAGAFHSISNKLDLFKLHKHSHLYTSNKRIDFPGRVFEIETVLAYNKKNLKTRGITKANITTRNFQETVQNLRKKYKIKDGGDLYLFFTTDMDNKKILIISKKKQIKT